MIKTFLQDVNFFSIIPEVNLDRFEYNITDKPDQVCLIYLRSCCIMRVKTFRGKNYIQFDEEELAAKYPEFYQDYLKGTTKFYDEDISQMIRDTKALSVAPAL